VFLARNIKENVTIFLKITGLIASDLAKKLEKNWGNLEKTQENFRKILKKI
jgi:hypothetical protein